MCSIIVWYDILTEINITSQKLQASLDVPGAMTQPNASKNYRTDNRFEKVLSDAKILVRELELESCLPELVSVRQQKNKRMFDFKERTTQ